MADATQLVASLSRNPLPAAKHESIVTTIGSTPVVKLQRMAPPGVEVFVKLESSNPGGSVKDRLALGLIEWAEQNGKLSPGQTVVEASSGNTGIGLAMVCASKGYPFVCVMAESFSIERRKLMRFLGAKVVLTNPAHKGTGMVIKAKELADKHGWYLTGQFDNEANAWVHSQTTGPEILQAMGPVPSLYLPCTFPVPSLYLPCTFPVPSQWVHSQTTGPEILQAMGPAGIDHWFSAYGTGGTLKGVSRVLRQQSPATKVHACEPDNAPLLYSSIETEYPPVGQGSFVSPHPVWRPHLLQVNLP
jgi:cysteine synthase A